MFCFHRLARPPGRSEPVGAEPRPRRCPTAGRDSRAGPVGARAHDRLRALVGASILALTAAGGSAAAPAEYPLACRYARVELDRHERCARIDGERVRIAPAHAARMSFRRGLAEAAVDGIGWLWVRRGGVALPVFTLDMGPDPFAKGLARGWHAGKVAFYDRRLKRVLATPYDWSFPFNAHGEALVCEGCRSDGREPASMIGGRWGVIDRGGRLLLPVTDGEAAFDRYFGRR